MGSFSLAGSSFMIFSYFRYPDLKTDMSQLVAWLALSDLLFAIGNVMGDQGADETLCLIQSVIRVWGALNSMFLSAAIAFVLHMKVLRLDPDAAKKIFERDYYTLLAFFFPFICGSNLHF